MFSHNVVDTDTCFESATWRINYRDTPGGAAKLQAHPGRSQLSAIDCVVIIALTAFDYTRGRCMSSVL